MPASRKRRSSGTSEHGFTIIEVLAGSLLAAIIVIAVGQSVSFAVRGARDNRFQQTATAISLTETEDARALSWDELAMTEVDVTAPLLAANQESISGDDLGLALDEGLALTEDGLVEPSEMITIDGVAYTVWRYVSLPDWETKRFTVQVLWIEEGIPHSRLSSTLVSDATADEVGVGGGP
jgi:type II secretory pathway pseudopilin PulG